MFITFKWQNKLNVSVFEPIEDDEARKIWLEIPRGTAEEWKAFDDMRSGYSDDEEDSLASYQEALDEDFCRENEWLFLVIFHEKAYPADMTWLMEPLLKLVKERVDTIIKDPEAYNRYIEENVPYRQRSGKIKSRDLNKILPQRKMKVRNRAYCIQVLKELVQREEAYTSVQEESPVDWNGLGVPAPFESMSIRRFCKYYRIADVAFFSKKKNKKTKSS